jgi:hypothetical protein
MRRIGKKRADKDKEGYSDEEQKKLRRKGV